VKGVVKVVETPMGLAVCAKSLDAAWKGRKALDVKWDQGALPQLDNAFIEKTMMAELDKPGSKAAEHGDAKKALEAAAKKVRSTYFVPYVAHALMEPINCTAYVGKDQCDVWAPTQGQTGAQALASQISGFPPDKVNIHTTYMGCGLGRRAAPDFVVEAVGTPRTYEQALAMVRPGGTVAAFGICAGDDTITVRPFDLVLGEKTIVGSCAGVGPDWPDAIALLAYGHIKPQPLFSLIVPLEELEAALNELRTNPNLTKVFVSSDITKREIL
jgi:threonine dehydrogenase-like Zn-dependent dehydrogenase